MSKFDGLLSEAAYAIAGHGFEEDSFGSVQDIGWNGLVMLTAVTLMNVGEEDLSRKIRYRYRDREVLVWIKEDSQGFVWVSAHSVANKDHLRAQFEAASAEAAKETVDATDQ